MKGSLNLQSSKLPLFAPLVYNIQNAHCQLIHNFWLDSFFKWKILVILEPFALHDILYLASHINGQGKIDHVGQLDWGLSVNINCPCYLVLRKRKDLLAHSTLDREVTSKKALYCTLLKGNITGMLVRSSFGTMWFLTSSVGFFFAIFSPGLNLPHKSKWIYWIF